MCSKQKFVKLNNGHFMPAIGLGTWQMNNEKDVRFAMNNALELGYRHFDTAYFYQNEHLIGEVIKEWIDSNKLKREDLFITTKLPMTAMWAYRVNEFLKISLNSLQLDYIDLYVIQFPIGLQNIDEQIIPKDLNGHVKLDEKISLEAVWKAMEHEVKVGRTKSIGISNFNQSQMERILQQCKIVPAVLQIEVNIYCQQNELRQYCRSNNIHVTAYGPFGSSNYPSNIQNPLITNPVVQKISIQHKRTPAQILLQFLLQQGVSIIPKTVRLNRLKENFEIWDFNLSQDELNQLEKLDHGKNGHSKKTYFSQLLKGIENHPEYPWRD